MKCCPEPGTTTPRIRVELIVTTTLSGGTAPGVSARDVTAVPSVPVGTVSVTWPLVLSTTGAGVTSGSGEVIAYTTPWVGTGPSGLKLNTTVVKLGSGDAVTDAVKLESPAIWSVSARGTMAKLMRLEPSEPTVAWIRAVPTLNPVSTPVDGSMEAVGSTDTQVTAADALSPFLSSGRAPSWMDSPTSRVSGPGTCTSIPTTPACPSSRLLQPATRSGRSQASARLTATPEPGCPRCRAARSPRAGSTARRRAPWAGAREKPAGARRPAARRPA